MHRDELQDHVFSTYINLRYGMAIIAAAFPLVVYLAGRLDGVPLQDSISAYYWASGTGALRARVWFVGCLFAVAAFLYLYKGFTDAENHALNLAAILLVGVAVFPPEWQCQADCGRFSIHGFCAVAMFLCLVYVVWFRAGDTLYLLPEEADRRRYGRLYKAIGTAMLASPVTAFIVNSLVGARTTVVFFIEAAGIGAFAAYWWLKSSELEKSRATQKALHAQISM